MLVEELGITPPPIQIEIYKDDTVIQTMPASEFMLITRNMFGIPLGIQKSLMEFITMYNGKQDLLKSGIKAVVKG